MQHISSKNNTSYSRSRNKNDDWRKQSYLATKKANEIISFPDFKFDGTARLVPGQATVLITLMLLGSVFTEEVKAVTSKTAIKGSDFKNSANCAISHSGASSQDSLCTTTSTSSKINDNVLSVLTVAQLLDAKFKVDSAIPKELHKDLQCKEIKEKIQQTVEIFPTSEGPIRRVLEHPEFGGVVCTSKEQLSRMRPGEPVGFFGIAEREIYFAEVDCSYHSTISHEFIHADYFFLHTSAPFHANALSYLPCLPFYPGSKENVKLYNKALDEGDKRVDNFKKLKQKRNEGKILSTEESELFKKYEDASNGSLTVFFTDVEVSGSVYRHVYKAWQEKRVPTLIMSGLEMEIKLLDVKRRENTVSGRTNPIGRLYYWLFPEDPTVRLYFRLFPDDAVCVTPEFVSQALNLETYQNIDEEELLLERDALTFEKLSENAIKMFYPEAYKMRTRDLERSGIKQQKQYL
ncbi:MAG: hypothetical protein K0R08_2068 [Solimicrobium sp.]|nr:hypothetical protein [Solimicrobium sp.]